MLGDTILNLPVIDALKNLYADCHITLVCHPSLVDFLDGHPAIDRFIPWEAGRRKASLTEFRSLLAQVKRGGFELAIISNARKDLHLITFLSGIQRRIGYRRKWGFLLTDALDDRKFLGQKHEIESNLALLSPLGIRLDAPVFTIPGALQDMRSAEELLLREQIASNSSFIILHPLSTDPRKCWTAENFAKLMDAIKKNAHVEIVLIGSKEESTFADALIARSSHRIYNLAGKTSLKSLCGVIRKSLLLIGHDSGPMHLAAGVGTPTVSIFAKFPGGPDPRRWKPWGEGHTLLHEALDKLSADEVWQHVCLKLSQIQPSALK